VGSQQRVELHDLYRLALPWQPTGEQAPITKGQRSMPSLSRQGSQLAASTSCMARGVRAD
jgi:hypothetical protein